MQGRLWFGIVLGIIFSALVGLAVLPFLGVFPTSARGKPNILDWWGHTNLESSLRWRAPDSTLPADARPAHGFGHYLSTCIYCHGGPDVPRKEWANHMLPKPPELWHRETQEHLTDGELFYIISNGIRMTGMPAFGVTHGDRGAWNMVAFVRQLDELSEEQKQIMQDTMGASGHGHSEKNGNHHDEEGKKHAEDGEAENSH
jgi:mono/diheme cytochrome c family protein